MRTFCEYQNTQLRSAITKCYCYFSYAFYYYIYYFSPSTLYFVGGLLRILYFEGGLLHILHFEGDLLRVLYFEDGLHCIHEVVAA